MIILSSQLFAMAEKDKVAAAILRGETYDPFGFEETYRESSKEATPAEAVAAFAASAAAPGVDSFQLVEAILKEEDLSTSGLDAQDWEIVSEMVDGTENSVTNFFRSDHVKLDEPKADLPGSLKAMEDTIQAEP